jgi:hypothetical protein
MIGVLPGIVFIPYQRNTFIFTLLSAASSRPLHVGTPGANGPHVKTKQINWKFENKIMKNLNSTLATSVAMAALLVTSLGHAQDAARYEPKTKTIAGSLPMVKEYSLTISSPLSLNKKGEDELRNGVAVELRAESTSRPETASETAALSYVSVDPASLTYTELNQSKTVTVRVYAPAEAVAGDYSYGITAAAASGLGWGLASATLNLSLVAAVPQESDDTPPIVTISKPPAMASFTYSPDGTGVELAFEAFEDGKAGSTITGVGANANGTSMPLTALGLNTAEASASGNAILNSIGVYTLTASAASAGGIGDATVDVAVNYLTSWLPPLSLGKTSKGGSTVPVKFTVRDSNGAFVRDESVQVQVYEVSTAGDVLKLQGVYGESALPPSEN